MATLTPQQVTLAGTVVTFTAAAVGGDKALPGATSTLRVNNGGVGSITVTLDSVLPSSYGDDAGVVKEILLSRASRFAGPDGLVSVTYSGVTSVTVANTYS